jgi:hypothetical protein
VREQKKAKKKKTANNSNVAKPLAANVWQDGPD